MKSILKYLWIILFFSFLRAEYKLGIETISRDFLKSHGKHSKDLAIGLVTNQTGKDQSGLRTIDILLQHGMRIKRIFVPEHGLEGIVSAQKNVNDTIDRKTKIPVISLYGHGTGKKIGVSRIKDLDVILFDMQDSGMRHYTYVSTLFQVMQTAERHNKTLIIFDRPNPLGGIMEGPLVDRNLHSFIAVASIPLRHGMTIGELANYFNTHILKKRVKLHVVKMKNYDRRLGLQGDLPAPLSPNIPSKAACLGYSFLGLLGEVRPFDTGLGTDNVLQYIALPETVALPRFRWQQLQLVLKRLGLETTLCSYYSTRKKKRCYGLQLVRNYELRFSSFNITLAILRFMHQVGVKLTFSPLFDKAAGSDKVRRYVMGKITWQTLAHMVNQQLAGFHAQAQDSYFYNPTPERILMKEKKGRHA